MENNLKAVSITDTEFRVANYMILFGGRDVTGEYFTAETEIDSPYTKSGMIHVDFEHGLDPDKMGMDSNEVLGYIDWKTAKIDDTGVFVERVLNRQARYMDRIETLIKSGLLGTSSEAIQGKTERQADGRITKWPLMRDSLTFTPAEPRMISTNALRAAKSLRIDMPDSKSLEFADKLDCVKTEIQNAVSLKDCERLLRDAGGFSRTDAQTLVARIKSLSQSDSDAKSSSAVIVDVFQKFNNSTIIPKV